MMVVEIDTTPSFSAERPKIVFEGSFLSARWARSYDLSPDGKTFGMIQSEVETAQREIKLVLNWFEELERLVPVN